MDAGPLPDALDQRNRFGRRLRIQVLSHAVGEDPVGLERSGAVSQPIETTEQTAHRVLIESGQLYGAAREG